jgi:hypothetical protein
MTLEPTVWYAGRNNYKKHTYEPDYFEPKMGRFTTELLDVETRDLTNIHDIIADDLRIRQTKTVEVLFSGGMDSECVIRSCLYSKIPVRALTARFMVRGYPVNTHDLYYAEKFCREHNVEQVFVDLDAVTFFESGKFADYIVPYNIWYPHVAVHFWIFEQATGFPVLGGEYSWPWATEKIISPHRIPFMSYDRFMHDRGIHGIGSMLGNSLESNCLFIKNHLQIVRSAPAGYYRGEDDKITILKKVLYKQMGFGDLELRMKNYGWDMVGKDIFDLWKYCGDVVDQYGESKAVIKWGNKIAEAMSGAPGSNDRHI